MLKKAKVIYYLNDTKKTNKNFLVNLLKKSNVEFISKEEEELSHLVSYLPPGTIFAQSFGIDENENILCLPMMSLHVSLPVKQGEFIWYMTDEFSKKREKKLSLLILIYLAH